MTRKQKRAQVLARERLIRQKLAEGRTRAEIANDLGVSLQRIYDFLHQAKNRPKLIVNTRQRVEAAIAEERRLKALPVHIAGGGSQRRFAEELRDLLLRSEYESRTSTLTGAVIIAIQKTRARPRPRVGVDRIIWKVRSSALAAGKTELTRLRVHGRKRINR